MAVAGRQFEWQVRQNRSICASRDIAMAETHRELHVSLIAIPDAVISTLTGVYDVMNAFKLLGKASDAFPEHAPFRVEIVGEQPGPVMLVSGLPVSAERGIGEIEATDIIIVPSILLSDSGWTKARHPELVVWLKAMHARGAMLCSACSGIFLLAETGLFDGVESTVHWAYAEPFRRSFPAVPVFPDRVLVVAGDGQRLVSSGASMTWHDLVLYLIARHVGTTAAQAVAHMFALQWHHDGLAPYIVFDGPKNHGDAAIVAAQEWLAKNFSVGSPVEEMIRHAGVAERTFKRRFTQATGYSPIEYVQRLRIEDAKRRLERTDAPVDDIAWKVGYEDAAFFRRLFKRTTGLPPGVYRRRFQIPDFAGGGAKP
jgi:transcriptional regulator GlxA family with amidase domain